MAQRSLSLGTRFRRQPLAPSGATLRAPGVDRESAAKQRSLPCHQCRTALARARSKWKQERVVNFALDNEGPRAFACAPSSLPARPFGLRGLTAKARPSKGVCRAINAELRLREPGASGNRSVWRTLCLTTKAPYKDCTV